MPHLATVHAAQARRVAGTPASCVARVKLALGPGGALQRYAPEAVARCGPRTVRSSDEV